MTKSDLLNQATLQPQKGQEVLKLKQQKALRQEKDKPKTLLLKAKMPPEGQENQNALLKKIALLKNAVQKIVVLQKIVLLKTALQKTATQSQGQQRPKPVIAKFAKKLQKSN